ncbi:MAG: LacI family transcriptional regulator [Verrucomicrobia bacterium]|nr:LacI family transcriptional regulator [Verrucomicrobiota bacterium]NBS13790.1 LacI family transcriptional regulator [Verrucomicrobiota bacterium]
MISPNQVSLRQIAVKAGVTRMAVSLALRGKPGVSDLLKRKIQKISKRMGYAPDPEVAKFLSHIRSHSHPKTKACLALLVYGEKRGVWKRSPTERKYIEGAEKRAAQYGYKLEEFWVNEPGMSIHRLGKVIWNRGIEGVIIAPWQQCGFATAPRILDLDLSLFSAVEISETIETPDLDRSMHDQYTSMLKCLEELSKLGYRRMGLVLEDSMDQRVNGRWTAAYLYHREKRGGDRTFHPLILSRPDQSAFDRWCHKHEPDVVISVDRFGFHLIHGSGRRIPREIGYASLDLDGDAEDALKFSGIDQNSRQVGESAVDLLISLIHRGQRGVPAFPVRIEVEGNWKHGPSTCLQRKR